MHKPVFCAWSSILRDIGGFDLKFCNVKKKCSIKGDLGREGRTERRGQNETAQGAQERKPFPGPQLPGYFLYKSAYLFHVCFPLQTLNPLMAGTKIHFSVSPHSQACAL